MSETGSFSAFEQPQAKKAKTAGAAAVKSETELMPPPEARKPRGRKSSDFTSQPDDAGAGTSASNPYAASKSKVARANLHPLEIIKALCAELDTTVYSIYLSDYHF